MYEVNKKISILDARIGMSNDGCNYHIMSDKRIQSALISVFYKEGLADIVKILYNLDVKIYSTGGTFSFINDLIYLRRKLKILQHIHLFSEEGLKHFTICFWWNTGQKRKPHRPWTTFKIQHSWDRSVIVDLYPFEETVKSVDQEDEIIEKIDIGGISLIRAAAKNYKDVLVVSGREQYTDILSLLKESRDIHQLQTDDLCS